jgi:hypothetical protein
VYERKVRSTALSDIAASLASKPLQNEFERGMAGFSLLIVRAVTYLLLVALVKRPLMRRYTQ